MRAPAPLLLLCALAAPRAEAAESYDNCSGFIDTLPATIATQGVWCLRHDVATSIASGVAITINANNVTIDCNDYKVGGLGAGPGSATLGIYTSARLNPVVRNCNLRGFHIGIELTDTGGALVEDNLLDGSIGTGIAVRGDGSIVRRNRVLDTGDASQSVVIGIETRGGVDVVDNLINVVEGTYTYGVHASLNYNGVIAGNSVRGLSFTTFGTGIHSADHGRITIRDNTVVGPGTTGIRCAGNLSTSTNNVVAGFGSQVSGCWSSGDVVNPN